MEETAKKDTGILLLAMGAPAYGNYAANLAMSIKFNYPNLPVSLGYAGNAINHLKNEGANGRLKLFDKVIELPEKYYKSGESNTWIKAKNYIHSITPYENTLFLDADIVLFPKREKNLETIIESLKSVPFTIANRDYIDLSEEKINENYSLWVNVAEAKQAWGLEGRYYSCHSEFIWFKKSETAEFFGLVEQITEHLSTFERPRMPKDKGTSIVNGITVHRAIFGDGTPDELPFAIAMSKLKFYPHQTPFISIYWENTEDKRKLYKLSKLYDEFIGLSWGGNHTPQMTKKVYDELCRFYGQKVGFRHTPLMNKRQFANGRNHF